jgi:peroxiredoxin
VALRPGETKSDVRIELSKGGVLEVLVTATGAGKPVEGVRVSVYEQRRRQWYRGQTNSDGIGRIRLLPGTYQSGSAYKEGFSSFRFREPVTVMEGSTKRLKWELTAQPTIKGSIRDQNGEPVKGVTLAVCPFGLRDNVSSNAAGKFKVTWDPGFGFGALPDRRRTHLLVCRHVERNLGAVVPIPQDKGTLDIELKPAVTVSGKVVNPAGSGIADADVRIMLRHPGWASTISRDSIHTNTDGDFELKAIPVEHEYQLYIGAKGYGGKRVEIHADDAVSHLLEIKRCTLPRANLSVSGIVADVDGNPVADARIEVRGHGDGQPDRVVAQSDSQGRFTLEGVCEGRVNLSVDARGKGKRLSARVLTDGGADGIRIVAREGRAIVQNLRIQPYEDILSSNEKVIAGAAVDESGSPVEGVPVGVCCHKRLRENGKFSWMFSSFTDLKATTDEQGRFAIPIKEDGEYNLLFSPDNHAAVIVYDVPVGKKDLKVTLPVGGTVTGRLMRMDKGKKIPIPNAQMKIEQPDRASYTHLGFDRDRMTRTDSEGRFHFEHLRTKSRPHGSMSEKQWSHIPRVWQISYGETSKNIQFTSETEIDDFELIVKPGAPQTLIGSALPDFEGIDIDLAADLTEGKILLIFFFDMQQRPSRAYLRQLSARTQELKAKNVTVVAVQASRVDKDQLDDWCRRYNVSFPVGMIQDDEKQIRSIWGVRSLPWLIMTDRERIVKADGFSIAEIDKKLDSDLKD